MAPKPSRLAVVGLSVVALAFSAGLESALAQGDARIPAIVLPPLPDVDVKIGQPAAPPPRPIAPRSAAVPDPSAAAPAPLLAAPPARATQAPAATSPAAEINDAIRGAIEAAKAAPARLTPAQKQTREQIFAVYAQRNFAPLWVQAGGWNAAARGALARLAKAGDDGLVMKAALAAQLSGADEKALVAAELELSQAVVAYGQQASGGRFNPRSIGNLITDKPEVASPEKILQAVAAAADADEALAGFNPPHAGYRALRAKLAELRRDRPAEPVRVAAGPTLRLGMKDARLPSIRERLNVETTSDADTFAYDARVVAAVSAFQRGKGLPASGQLNPATLAALGNGGPARIEAEILANMERWRWLPRNASPDRIEVNIPDYTVRVTRAGQFVHSARVIVGKPDTPTPIFSNRMKFLEVNPYWNVPESIIKNEMMPRLAQDPTYLHRLGYEVSTNRKGEMVVRQPPGNRNALGFIKFMFPNEHAVYLHDTPTRGLFSSQRRAYSHGCVRVDQPFKLAEIVLGRDNGWSEERVKKMIGAGNRTINLPQQIDVHIQYFTAFVDDAGELQLRDDIYGHSRRLKAAMGLAG